MDTTQKVIEIIAREQHLDASKITIDSKFAELGIDSLDGVNILFALEEEFKIDIPDAVAQNMRSVRQVVDSLTRVLEGKDISDLVAMAKGEPRPPQLLKFPRVKRAKSCHYRCRRLCFRRQGRGKLFQEPGGSPVGGSPHLPI